MNSSEFTDIACWHQRILLFYGFVCFINMWSFMMFEYCRIPFLCEAEIKTRNIQHSTQNESFATFDLLLLHIKSFLYFYTSRVSTRKEKGKSIKSWIGWRNRIKSKKRTCKTQFRRHKEHNRKLYFTQQKESGSQHVADEGWKRIRKGINAYGSFWRVLQFETSTENGRTRKLMIEGTSKMLREGKYLSEFDSWLWKDIEKILGKGMPVQRCS